MSDAYKTRIGPDKRLAQMVPVPIITPNCRSICRTPIAARDALRLTHDLELNTAATAVVLDLIDEIAALKSRLRRLGRD